MEPPGRLVRAPARARQTSAARFPRPAGLPWRANPPSDDRPLCSTPRRHAAARRTSKRIEDVLGVSLFERTGCLVLRTELLGKLPDVLDPIYGSAGRSR